MRKLAILVPVFAFLALAQLASAQQGDIMIGGGTLISSSPATGLGNFQQPAEKGGTYINISGDVVGFKRHFGFGVEIAWRASQGNYPDYQNTTYRPILTDFNAVFQPKITKENRRRPLRRHRRCQHSLLRPANNLLQLLQRVHQLQQQ